MILDVRNIDTYYGLAHVLHGLSLHVDEGEVVALLGKNGAGKTTTMCAITGLTPSRTGAVLYKGQNIAGRPAHQISRLGIALVPEMRGVLSCLSARESLKMGRRPGARDDGGGARALSEAARGAGPQRLAAVRRRAADAGDRARDAHGPRSPAARRPSQGLAPWSWSR
jgi:ABC-type branched-subunit amino acid transport system ATPase component